MQEEVAKYIQRLYEIPLLDFTNKLVVNLDCTSRLFEYEIPEDCDSRDECCRWGAALTFSIIPFDDFLFLLFSLLLEKGVVLLASSAHILTSAM